MTPDLFNAQMQRLRVRFGDRAFDSELVQLVAAEVQSMTDQGFVKFVDVMIGTRHQSKPPLITDFRDAVLLERNNEFKRDVRGACDWATKRSPPEMREKLKRILSKEFGAVETVAEAQEIALLRRLTGGDE